MTEVVIQADCGGMTIAFTAPATNADEAALNAQVDLFAKVIGRQKSRQMLAEKLIDLMGMRKALASLPERERGMLKERADSRVRMAAAMAAAYQAGGKRAEWTPNPAQRTQLDGFDNETAAHREKLAQERQTMERDIPIVEAQISRLRAVIAGRDPLDPLEAEAAAPAEKEGAAAAA